jgi:glycosyltransferase involved in cell wall biosynthesis
VRIGLNAHLLSFEATYRQAGVSRYIEALVRHLPEAAPDDGLVVFSGSNRPPDRAGFDDRVEWRHSRLPTARPPVRILWEQTGGVVAARRARVDLLHSPVNVVAMATRIPQVVTVHDLAFHHFPEQYPGMKQRYLRMMTRLSVRRATRVIAVSEATRRDIIDVYGCDPRRVVTVPNGVDPEMRKLAADEVDAFRRDQNLPEQFFLFLGTLQPRKNVETLVRAFALVSKTVDWPLVVAGSPGWHYERIFQLVRELDLTERVRFVGHVAADQLALWYNAATVFAYPSLYEGFGLPLLEAMACGTAVVTSNASSLPEVVGIDGLIVDPRDVSGLAEAILSLALNDDLRQQLEERGQTRAKSFTWTNTALRTLEVYQQAAQESR